MATYCFILVVHGRVYRTLEFLFFLTWETLIQTSVEYNKIQESRARSRLLFFDVTKKRKKKERTASRAALMALTGVPRQLVVTEKSSTKLLRNFQS